jgi:hypothetical protein
VFKLRYDHYKEFIDKFAREEVGLDPKFYLVEALALCLYRPIIIISSLEIHKQKPILQFNPHADRPPLIMGLYRKNGYDIFTPFVLNKNTEFRLENLKNCIHIIAYSAKTVPETFKSRTILDLEVFGILTALHSFNRLISGVPVTLLTDSRVLYYLFSSKIGTTSVKIRRWCLKLISDYPNIQLKFVRSQENLADFLTREGLPAGDLKKFNIKNVKIEDFFNQLPKVDYTLHEWAQFCDKNPQFLKVEEENAVVFALNRGIENV